MTPFHGRLNKESISLLEIQQWIPSNELWQLNGFVMGKSRSNFFVFNKFKFAFPRLNSRGQ